MVRCFNCSQFVHFARACRKSPHKKRQKGKYHASTAIEEEEPQRKQTKAATKDQDERREYYLVSTLSGSISNSLDSWLIDSGASKHIIGFKQALLDYKDKKFNVKVELGDDGTYAIKGVGSTSF